jgi:hypothetical protein
LKVWTNVALRALDDALTVEATAYPAANGTAGLPDSGSFSVGADDR